MAMNDQKKPRLIHHIESALARVIGSMAGSEFTIVATAGAGTEEESARRENTEAEIPFAAEDAIIWQQSFSIQPFPMQPFPPLDKPCLWIGAGRSLWEHLGRTTLEAAGIVDVTEEDCRSTWQEIINQTVASIAAGMSAEQGAEIAVSKGIEIAVEPQGAHWTLLSVADSEGRKWPLHAYWTQEFAAFGEPRPGDEEEAGRDLERDSGAEADQITKGALVSKTFDLLLDVALPVAVSFGKTSLEIREVLKLNTGSIVELDRLVTDPVEIVVNDCVIARGEVVVVDGNYGVRIQELASREERLRSGMANRANKGVRL